MITTIATEGQELERVFFYAGDYEAALIEADSLIAQARTVDDKVTGYLSKARIYFEQFRYADSDACLRAVGGFIDDAAPRLKARFHGQRAASYIKDGKTDKALIDYEAGRHYAIEAEDKLCEACIRNNLSRVYGLNGRFEDAIQEVHAAMKIAEQLNEQFWLGRFMDQKAQILLDHKHYSEALSTSRKAIEVLELHGNERTLSEAQVTHGKAWIGVGASSLESASAFRVLREAVDNLNPPPDRKLIQMALTRSGGRVSQAADILGMSHPAMIKSVQKFGLDRRPKRRRAKSLVGNKK